MTVAQNFLVFVWLWQCWGVLAMNLVGCPSVGICLMFFLWLDWSYHFGEEGHRRKVLFSSHHIKSTWYEHNTSLLMLTLTTCWDRFYQVSLLGSSFSFLFLYCAPWMEGTMDSPHSMSQELCFISFERRVSSGIIWPYSTKTGPFSHMFLFIQPLIHIRIELWIFIFIISFLLWAINKHHFIFLIESFQLCSQGAFPFQSCVLWTESHHCGN